MPLREAENKSITKQREGILVKPEKRLSDTEIRMVDEISRELLEEPGLLCHNSKATELFARAGAKVGKHGKCSRICLDSRIIDNALKTAPSKVVLGAREPSNRLILDASEPRVRFGSGSETNVWLDVNFNEGRPQFMRLKGNIERLKMAAHLCENLENLDFFIRCVNIQDESVNELNKDVNKFFASFNNTTKHVQGGLTDISALDALFGMGCIIAGGEKSFEKNPVLSFITCVVKSPFEIVDDTSTKLIEISKRRIPVVISSCPMGGASGPFDELGMVAQVNAEVLAGIVLNQIACEGAPVLYGAVPVRTRLDNLNDMYAAPEFVHYTIDCAQMARYYGLPCYSTAGVADTDVPGIQATAEKLLTFLTTPKSGAQYVHYAFGLLERTNTFSPEQAILDDAHIGIVKRILVEPQVREDDRNRILATIREVMSSDHRTFVYNLPLPTIEDVYIRYPLEHPNGALYAAHERYREIISLPRKQIPAEIEQDIVKQIPGILSQTLSQSREER